MTLALTYFFTILLFSWFLPWWWLFLPAFVFGFKSSHNTLKTLGLSFIIIFIIWSGSAFVLDINTEGMIAYRISKMLGWTVPFLTYVMTGFLGGIVATIWSFAGVQARRDYLLT